MTHSRSTCLIVTACLSLLALSDAVRAQLPAFPGAEGFGALATGGRGGDVYIVTNLNDSGTGSLRDAISQPNRTVVFEVSGTINISNPLVFSDNLTVAGQTAPGGIAVYGHGVSLSGHDNIILQHMTFRQGINSPSGTKALNITDGHNIVLDHLSLSWGRWDTLGITGDSTNVTVQNSILSEAIDPQNFGALIDASRGITLARNLWADNQSRNPKGKGDLQYINNVVYNWGGNGYVGGHSSAVWQQDLINNYFIAGPSSSTGSILTQFTDTDWVYHDGNLVDLDRDGTLGGRAIVDSDFKGNSAGDAPTFVASPMNFPTIPVTTTSALDAYDWVLANAGNWRYRDSVDQRIVQHVQSLGTQGAIIVDEFAVGGPADIVGGTPPLDTSHDGIPDEFKLANGFGIYDVIHNVDSGDGYTWLEKYLHSVSSSDPPPIPPPPPTEPWTISTAFGRGADAQVTENVPGTGPPAVSGGDGTGDAMNARWTGTGGERNEYVLLRFDLADIEADSIHNATLALTAFRDMQDYTLRVYGLDLDLPDQLWDEATIEFDGAPALVFDGDSGTRGLDLDQVTALGDFVTSGIAEGQTVNFSTPGFVDFLNLAAAQDVGGEGGVATLLVERLTENTGQSRFATKEATHLESTSPGSVSAGTYAPQLLLQLLLSSPPGDYNGDGVVDAADYTVWRDNMGTTNELLNDPIGGMIGEEHYDQWRANFGRTAESSVGGGSTSAAQLSSTRPAVPEPTGLTLLAMGGLAAVGWRVRRWPSRPRASAERRR